MGQEKFNYKVITPDPTGKIDLGEYKDRIVDLRGKLFRDSRADEAAELDVAISDGDWAGVVIGADQTNNAVGYGVLKWPYQSDDPRTMELAEAYVEPFQRRQGIYKQVIELRIQLAIAAGATSVYVLPISPKIKQKPYLIREGFEIQPSEDGIIYSKKLL